MATIFSPLRVYQLSVFTLFASIAILHALGFQYSLYFHLWWYDIPMHMLGGLAIAVLSAYIFFLRSPKEGEISMNRIYTTILLSVFVVGILWEIFELVMHWALTLYWFGWTDTTKDLFDDMVGGYVGTKIFLAFYWKYRRDFIPQ